MTGYTVHTGTSKKFTEGWDQIFGSDKKKPSAKKKKATTDAKSSRARSKKK